jgi:hypothetical protein
MINISLTYNTDNSIKHHKIIVLSKNARLKLFISVCINVAGTKEDNIIVKIKIFPRPRLLPAISLVLTFFTVTTQAQATLGESADSIASDQKVLSSVRGVTSTSPGYTVHEIRSETTTIREYVSPSGIVFGIAWNGLTHPDLTSLLGTYHNDYQKILRQTPRQPGRRHVQMKTERVVVEKWGHMRNLQGRAYAPALIPQGVGVDEIK